MFDTPAELAGAYDLIENDHIDPGALARALTEFTLRRVQAQQCSMVWAPTDGTSASLTDKTGSKKAGRLTSEQLKTRGDKVHDALLREPDGTPLGLAAMAQWQRLHPRRNKDHAGRETSEKETQHWLTVRDSVRAAVRAHHPKLTLHFLHDREADAWPVLLDVVEHQEHEFTTLRARSDRRLWSAHGTAPEPTRKLRQALEASPLQGELELSLPRTHARRERVATLQLKACAVTLDLRDKKHSHHHPAPLWVLCAKEVDPPTGCEPVEWLLLTTYPLHTVEDCLFVLQGYSYRWRIEEFHQTWKSGGTDVEGSQLSAPDHRARWYLILAGAAAELLRWKIASRQTPNRPACELFTEEQLGAVRDMQGAVVVPDGPEATVWQVWISLAYLGGWAGAKTRPPGLVIVLRGWRRVADYMLGQRRRRLRQSSLGSSP